MRNDKFSLRKTQYGFLQVDPMPTDEELELFYKEKYFQDAHGPYSSQYSAEELRWTDNKARSSEWIANQQGVLGKRLLDVGCGEGFFAKYFWDRNWEVHLVDFSHYALKKFHPELLSMFSPGGFDETLKARQDSGKTYDLINLSNVLEHVADPVGLLQSIRPLLAEGGLLRIEVPNDFSPFQRLASNASPDVGAHWVVFPEHLNYFNFATLRATLVEMGYGVETMLGNFPVNFFLMHDFSKWIDSRPQDDFAKMKWPLAEAIEDPDFAHLAGRASCESRSRGKAAHRARVAVDNFIMSQGVENYVRFYEACAKVEIGRNAIAFASSKTVTAPSA